MNEMEYERERETPKELNVPQRSSAEISSRLHEASENSSAEIDAESLRNVTFRLEESLLIFLKEQVSDLSSAISRELILQIREPSAILDFDNLRRLDIYVADIEDNCLRLKTIVREASEAGDEFIQCLGDYKPIPIDRYTNINKPKKPSDLRHNPNEPYLVDIEKALSNTGSELTSFLKIRLAITKFLKLSWILGSVGGAAGSGGGNLAVDVHTQTNGARVSYSPSYFINYITLASPTTPVKGYIPPGRYVFKITTKAFVDHPDNGHFDIPPQGVISPIHLMV